MSDIKIGYGNLQPADIIITASNTSQSRAIRLATGADVSHALIYTGQSRIVEAVSSGVREVNIELSIDAHTNLAIALRHHGLRPEQRQKIIENARKFVGLKYDTIGAAGAGMTGTRGFLISLGVCGIIGSVSCKVGQDAIHENASNEKADKAFFCSELVARAFELAEASLVEGKPSFANPGMVHRSKILRYVGHLRGA